MEREAMDPRVAACLSDYRRRADLGETPRADDYRDRTGDSYTDFLKALETETLFDVAGGGAPEESFPREFGHYRLLGVLGRGAMGVVYDAVDLRLDRPVALKVLRTGFDPGSSALARFDLEARACAKVRHDSVVEIYETGEEEGRPFYSMTRVEGRPLSGLITEGALPAPDRLLEGFAGIADALHALHESGVVHRDVKPSNILVDVEGRLILADFGLARTAASGDLTQTGEALGTPLYMSPEQVLGKRDEIDGRADVYGLGATLYETFCGRPVLQADDTRGMLQKILHERPRRPRELVPGFGRAREAVILKALEKRREDRYPTAAVMRDDLLALAEGRPVVGRPVGPVRRFARRWWGLSLAAAAVIALVAYLATGPDDRRAVLEVLSHPPATVWIDGEEVGETPISRELPPGDHELVMRLPGFREHRQRIELEPGSKRTFERVLVAENPEDPMALASLADSFRVPFGMAPRRPEVKERGAAPAVQALLPRGNLRPGDLDLMCISAHPAFEGVGTLTIERGDELLYTRRIEPRAGETDVEVPPEVRAVLRDGDELVWGFHPDGGDPTYARCRVVGDTVRDRMAKLDELLKDQHPHVRAHLRVRLLLSQGLDYAAFREAQKVAREAGGSVNALVVMREALKGMELRESGPWRAIERRLSKIPKEQREKLLGTPEEE
jgi:hypothetical protein